MPEALGIFRSEDDGDSPKAGVKWGLAHLYDWQAVQGASNYLVRFDIVPDATPVKPVNPPTKNGLIIEAESYFNTSGTFDDSSDGGNGLGANKTSRGVNFVNSEDYMEYNVTIPKSGNYNIFYEISTPANNAQVQFSLDGNILAQTNIPSNGGWDNYGYIKHNSEVTLTAGQHTVTILASGTDTWQWNLDKIILSPKSTLSIAKFLVDSKKISVFPNPVKNQLGVSNLKNRVAYSIYNLEGSIVKQGKIDPNKSISISNLTTGAYVLVLSNKNEEVSSVFVKQ